MNEKGYCRHCGLPVSDAPAERAAPAFCCFGCSVAYDVSRPPDGKDTASLSPLHIRIAVSTMFAMAVMMFSLVSYADFVDPAAATDGTFQVFSQLFSYLAFLCALPVILLLGAPLVKRLRDVHLGHSVWLEMLVLLGVSAAFVLSAVNLIRGAGHTYFETVVFTLLLWSVGRYLEARVRTRTMLAVKQTETALTRRLTRVTLGDDGEQLQEIEPDQLNKGEIVRVLAGGQVPVDGRIIRGRAWVDESITSGEQIPVLKAKGDAVSAGSLVVDATLDVRVATDARSSGLHRLRDDVRRALEERGRLAYLAERASRVLVLVTLVLGVGTFAYWLGTSGWSQATLTALSVFLVACPCSLGIAVPLVVYFGLNRAREAGALFRSGDSLERAAAIDRIAFDRTGTLTGRAPKLAGVEWFDIHSQDQHAVWSTVVSALRQSSHPFATAVTDSDEAKHVSHAPLSQCITIPGRGLRVETPTVAETVRVGSRDYLEGEGLSLPDEAGGVITASTGASLVSVGEQVVCRLNFEENMLAASSEAVAKLDAYEPVILTGGAGGSGQTVWPQHTRLSPEDKQAYVRGLKSSGHKVAMVGDGLNDVVALGLSDLSVAPAGAQSINLASADLRLLHPGMDGLARALQIAGIARRRMIWNIAWSVIYNSVGLGLAVTGKLHPLAAACAMLVSSLVVLWNSKRWPAG